MIEDSEEEDLGFFISYVPPAARTPQPLPSALSLSLGPGRLGWHLSFSTY